MSTAAKDRMAAYRRRQRGAGLSTLTLVVPQEDATLFRELAAQRCRLKTLARPRLLHPRRFSAIRANNALPAAQRSPTARAGRRADALADTLLQDVIRMGWPVGKALGSEAELIKAHGVSRTVLRQSIRLLEHHGIARMQRGAGGGLVVDAPDAATTARAVGIYLEYQRIAPAEIVETRRILEQATVSLAVARLTAAGEQRLRDDIETEASLDGHAPAAALQRFHLTIAELSGDPALGLFTGIVLQLSDAHSTFSRRPAPERETVVRRIRTLHRRIAEAMLARDAQAARDLMARYLVGYREWLE